MSPGGGAGGGAASGNLANLIIQFVTQGQAELKKSLEDVQMAIGAVVLAVQKFNTQTVAAMEASKAKTKEAGEQTNKLGESFKKVGDIINFALGAGVGIIANFVRQGMAAGVMGQLFGYTMERLSLTISGLFRPELQKVLDLINRLTSWLQNLTNAQRQQIAYWIQGAAAALAVGIVLPRIVAGIEAVIGATKALGAAIAGAEAITGIGAILPLLGLIAQGITVLLVGTEQGRAALARMWESLKLVGDASKKLWDALHMSDVFSAMVEGVVVIVELFADWIAKTAQLISMLGRLADRMNQVTGSLNTWRDIILGTMGLQSLFALSQQRKADADKENRQPDAHRAGGFEDLNTTYQRIAVAAMRASAGVTSPEERTARNTEMSLEQLRVINANTANRQNPFAR